MQSIFKIIATSLSFAIVICISHSCQGNSKKNKVNSTPLSVSKQVEHQKPIEFIAPTDSIIKPEQMKSWLACNPLLDSLAYMYSDSFKTADPKLRIRYQDDFSNAQDKICLKAGLHGGYKEYRWIMENMGNPKNKPLLESLKASTY